MFERTKTCTGLLIAFGTTIVVPAQAQDTATPDVQRVEVTGSSIKRINQEGALPIQTLSADDIRKSGATSITELIQGLPAMQGFETASQSVNGGGGGVTTASLHDMGSQYTLVLLNGRRVANYSSQGGGVNLNSIPLAAIERVEVLTDGASALYGSDAIAGVVNFITKKDASDGALSLSAYKPQKAGGGSASASISKGFGDLDKDRYNILLSAQFDNQERLKSTQRSFSKTGLLKFKDQGQDQEVDLTSSYATPANASVLLSNGDKILINPYKLSSGSCASGNVSSDSGTLGTTGYENRCLYDYSATVDDIPSSRRATLFGSGRFVLSDKVQLFSELALSHFETEATFAAPAQQLQISQALLTKDIDPLLSSLGYGSDVTSVVSAKDTVMNIRLVDAGGRRDRYVTDAIHAVVGTDFTLGAFDGTLSLTHSVNRKLDIAEGGYMSDNALEALIDDGKYDPLTDAAGTASDTLASAVLHQSLETDRNTLDTLATQASTTIGRLPGGDVGLGFGASFSRERYLVIPSAIEIGTTDGIIGGSSGVLPYDSSRNAWGVFAELNAPVTKKIELDASARFDSSGAVDNKETYDTDGNAKGESTQGRRNNSITYKLSTLLRPTKEILLRGSIGTGFKAPSLYDVSSPLQAYGNTAMHTCPPGLSAEKAAYCQTAAYEYNAQAGGNPATGSGALKPERSLQWTLGARFEPSQAFSIGADLWTVRLRDQINTITEDTAFSNGALYDSLFKIVNDPVSGVPTLTFLEQPINTGKAIYEGIDLDGEGRTMTPAGRLTTRAHATYMIRADYQVPGLGGYVNDMNKIGEDGQVTFRYQFNVSFTLESGKFTNTLTTNFKSGYMDDTEDYCRTDSSGNCLTTASGDDIGRHVSSYETFDWQTKVDVTKALALTVGIKNLFDRDPPFSLIDQSGTGNARGYDGRYADPIGRQLYVNATYRF